MNLYYNKETYNRIMYTYTRKGISFAFLIPQIDRKKGRWWLIRLPSHLPILTIAAHCEQMSTRQSRHSGTHTNTAPKMTSVSIRAYACMHIWARNACRLGKWKELALIGSVNGRVMILRANGRRRNAHLQTNRFYHKNKSFIRNWTHFKEK